MSMNLLIRLSQLLHIRPLFRLNRQIDALEAELAESRRRVRADYTACKNRLWRNLASPTSLAVSFGAGFAFGLLPRPAERTTEERPLTPRLLNLGLRLLLSPVVWSWFSSSAAAEPPTD